MRLGITNLIWQEKKSLKAHTPLSFAVILMMSLIQARILILKEICRTRFLKREVGEGEPRALHLALYHLGCELIIFWLREISKCSNLKFRMFPIRTIFR